MLILLLLMMNEICRLLRSDKGGNRKVEAREKKKHVRNKGEALMELQENLIKTTKTK
jgi:hypothetical protein